MASTPRQLPGMWFIEDIFKAKLRLGAGGPGRSRDPPHASRCQLNLREAQATRRRPSRRGPGRLRLCCFRFDEAEPRVRWGEDPLDAAERRAHLMCGKPEVEDVAAPEEIDEEFDPLLARAKALSLHASRVAAELESQIAAVGWSSAPVETAPAPAVVVSKEEEDLVARARALLSDAEPAPTPTRVEPADDGLDVDMDLIRRARALRGASQLARTESK